MNMDVSHFMLSEYANMNLLRIDWYLICLKVVV